MITLLMSKCRWRGGREPAGASDISLRLVVMHMAAANAWRGGAQGESSGEGRAGRIKYIIYNRLSSHLGGGSGRLTRGLCPQQGLSASPTKELAPASRQAARTRARPTKHLAPTPCQAAGAIAPPSSSHPRPNQQLAPLLLLRRTSAAAGTSTSWSCLPAPPTGAGSSYRTHLCMMAPTGRVPRLGHQRAGLQCRHVAHVPAAAARRLHHLRRVLPHRGCVPRPASPAVP